MPCSYYAVLLAYVAESTVFTRVVKRLEGMKARIVFVDEASRRIVANVPVRLLGELAGKREWFSYASVELKATCRTRTTVKEAARVLRAAGFRLAGPPRERLVLYGIIDGRLVEVELLREGKVRVKLGVERDTPPQPPLPPSLFSFPLEEAPKLAELLKAVASKVSGLLRGAGSAGRSGDWRGAGEAPHSATRGEPHRPGEGES